MSVQFVSCNDTSCPMNQSKTCRAPYLFVDENGNCKIKHGPKEEPSPIEKYVELRECRNCKCNQWVLDEASQLGQCNLRADLFFFSDTKKPEDKPICFEYMKQITEPGFPGAV